MNSGYVQIRANNQRGVSTQTQRTIPTEEDAGSKSPKAGDDETAAATLHFATLGPLSVYLEWRQVGAIVRLYWFVVIVRLAAELISDSAQHGEWWWWRGRRRWGD